MKLEQNSIDARTHLVSSELALGNTITMERDVYLHSANSYFTPNIYFEFSNSTGLTIVYDNYSYIEEYNFSTIISNKGEEVKDEDRENFPLATILDSWFHEKVEINKTTGKLRYYVNGEFIG